MTVLRNIDISKSKKIENCRHHRTARNMKMKIDDFLDSYPNISILDRNKAKNLSKIL